MTTPSMPLKKLYFLWLNIERCCCENKNPATVMINVKTASMGYERGPILEPGIKKGPG